MSITFGTDPVRDEVQRVLQLLDTGAPIVERQYVDLKEEPGRRDRSGEILDGSPINEIASEKLAGESACMANTPGGGALIVGVADDATLIGTSLDSEWLRNRIYELTDRRLTVDVQVVHLAEIRLLVLFVPTAVEPIRWKGRITWRVSDKCVEVDAATWHAKRMHQLHYDWSVEESTVPGAEARPAALQIARDFLRDSNESAAIELAAAPDLQLLRRLNAVTNQGYLTNAGVLTFVGRDDPCLDYMHRAQAGSDSTQRVRRRGRSMLEELTETFASIEAHNDFRHLRGGIAIGQLRDIPPLAAREAVVNGLAHREWGVPEPTVVEHVGRTLRVTSPGGFYGGVTESNIITHPSQSRNRALTQLLADLRVAEREGIGVDRMIGEMVRVGHQPPDIREISGPFVRASLIGDSLDESWIRWLRSIEPAGEAEDLNSLLILRLLVLHGWTDAKQVAPEVQLTIGEARGAINKLAQATLSGEMLICPVRGVPAGAEPAWRLSIKGQRGLVARDSEVENVRNFPSRETVARHYACERGRISTTELGSILGSSPTNLGSVLRTLEAEGDLVPAWPSRRGKGFFYKSVMGT